MSLVFLVIGLHHGLEPFNFDFIPRLVLRLQGSEGLRQLFLLLEGSGLVHDEDLVEVFVADLLLAVRVGEFVECFDLLVSGFDVKEAEELFDLLVAGELFVLVGFLLELLLFLHPGKNAFQFIKNFILLIHFNTN